MKLKTNFAPVNKYPAFYASGKIHVTSDGSFIFCVCDRKINVINVSKGVIHQTIADDESDDISCFAVSSDDEVLIVSRRSLRLQQYDWRENHLVRTWKAVHTAPILSISFDVTSTLLATGSSDSTVKVCDIVQKTYTNSLRANQGVVSLVQFHPDISRLILISVSADNKLRIWCLKTSSCLHILDKHLSTVTSLLFDRRLSQNLLMSGSRDGVVVVWDADTWNQVSLTPVFEPVESMAVFPSSVDLDRFQLNKNEIHFITAGSKGHLRIWDSKKGKCTHKLDVNSSQVTDMDEQIPLITQMIANSASHTITVTTFDHNIIIYDAQTLDLKKQMTGYNSEVLDAKFFGSDDSHIVVVTNSEQLKSFEVATWNCNILSGHTDIVLAVDTCNTRHLMASSSKDNTIRLWSYEDLNNIRCISVLHGHVQPVGALTISRTAGNFIISGSQDCTIKKWDIPSKLNDDTNDIKIKASAGVHSHDKDVNSVAVSLNDSFIASGSLDKLIKVWRSEDLSLLGVCRGHTRSVWCTKFSPVEKCIVSSSADGTIKMWSLEDFTCFKSFEGHDSSVLFVTFLSSGRQLLSGGSDGLMKLWTIKSCECIKTLAEHDGKVWSIAVSSDQQTLVSCGSDATIICWKDVSETELEEQKKKQDEFILKEQEFYNLVQEKDYRQAIKLAINLDQPSRLLSLFKDILNQVDGNSLVEETIQSLSLDYIGTLLNFTSEWNKNSRHSFVAQLILSSILRAYTPSDILSMPNARVLVESLLPYTERHYDRLRRLRQQSCFVDFTWRNMRSSTQTIGTERESMDTTDHVTHPQTNQRQTVTVSTISEDQNEELDLPKAIRLAALSRTSEHSSNTTVI